GREQLLVRSSLHQREPDRRLPARRPLDRLAERDRPPPARRGMQAVKAAAPLGARLADRDRLVGSVWGVGAALSYGVVVVVQRSLAKDHLPVATVVGGRYAVAAVLLVAAMVVL